VFSLNAIIIHALNAWVGYWPQLDAAIVMFQRNNLLKGALLVAPLYYFWFCAAPTAAAAQARRARIIASFSGVLIALLIARIIVSLAPFHPRPILDAAYHLNLPAGISRAIASTDSAFPSDHATVWFALATAIALLDRRWGLAAFAYAVLLGLGRVYVGFHSPGDIAAGAAIAISIVLFVSHVRRWTLICGRIVERGQRSAGFSAALLFLATSQMASMFDDVRWIGKAVVGL
jgi:undecaprenyl-diphosphatase